MFRIIIRLFLLAYFVMPVVAGFLVVRTFAQIRDDVTPIYEAASMTITRATTALDTELRNLGRSFSPLADAVNATRGALQTVINFLRGAVSAVIDAVNAANVACSLGHTACIQKIPNIRLPTIIDLSFVNNISASIADISGQVNNVITTTTGTIGSYTTMLALAVVVFVAWILLSYVLFMVYLYTGLWKRTSTARAQ